ncbi:MAG: hypothetical protein IPP29_17250 [Bacteroidetes bacterium]|nr:hypothetical protein [Bacteroidota bacterium]
MNDTLIAGKEYKIVFWSSVPNGASYQVDRLGAYISKDSLLSPLPFNFNVIPQIQTQQGVLMVDTLNWFEIKGNYIAQGGEQFITIGNFYDNANTMVDSIFGIQPNFFAGYFFIDDVYVVIDTALVIDENANANCDLEVIAINQNVILLKSDCQLNNVTIYNLWTSSFQQQVSIENKQNINSIKYPKWTVFGKIGKQNECNKSI